MFVSRPIPMIPISLIKKLARPLGTWAGFSGLYAMMDGACPCCGQPSCPVGLLGAGFVGGLLAAGLHFWRRLTR